MSELGEVVWAEQPEGEGQHAHLRVVGCVDVVELGLLVLRGGECDHHRADRVRRALLQPEREEHEGQWVPNDRGAAINYTKCQHTSPSFEAKISRSPALSCPTATCSRQSAPSSQNSRREDGPMSLPPEALEL